MGDTERTREATGDAGHVRDAVDTPFIPPTPVVAKQEATFRWPAEQRTFYLLSRDGLFLCRNHEFFTSCAPARGWPTELAAQQPFLEPRYPPVPRAAFERVVGFFDRVGTEHGAEAAVLLLWDRRARRVRIVVPRQVATVGRSRHGDPYPIGLHYYPPTKLPAHLFLFGDIHSHVDLGAYASGTDIADESHSAGLHIVVGRIHRDPPDVHVEAVVDGARFRLEPEVVLGGYHRRDERVPRSWLERVEVRTQSPAWYYPARPLDHGEGS